MPEETLSTTAVLCFSPLQRKSRAQNFSGSLSAIGRREKLFEFFYWLFAEEQSIKKFRTYSKKFHYPGFSWGDQSLKKSLKTLDSRLPQRPQRLQESFGKGGVRWAKWVPALSLLSGSALTLHWNSAEEICVLLPQFHFSILSTACGDRQATVFSFPDKTATGYIDAGTLRKDLDALTACLWLKTSDTQNMAFITYEAAEDVNAFSLFNNGNKLQVISGSYNPR